MIACPECGCERWWRSAEETERGVDVLELDEDGVVRISFEGHKLNRDVGGKLSCYDNDHEATDEIYAMFEDAEEEWV